MRFGVAFSVVAHAAILITGMMSLSSARKIEVTPTESIPVDIVSAEALDEMKRGSKTGEKKPEVVPEPVPEVSEKPKEAPPEEKTKAEAEPEAAAPPPPPPAPKEPEPAPEKAPEPPKAAEAPPPPKPEPKPEPKREPKPKREAKKPEPEPEPKREAKKEKEKERESERKVRNAEERSERNRERERDRKPRQKNNDEEPLEQFDPGQIAALLNKSAAPRASNQDEQEPPPEDETASLGSPRGSNARVVASEIAALAGQVQDCWNPPIGAESSSELQVQLRIVLAPDGSVANTPTVIRTVPGPMAQVAAESAVRAVLRCQPYNISPETYEQLRGGFVFNFDPSEMFGG